LPFTPFHIGPGLALKGIAGRRFSLIAFGAAQVAMDIEPGVGMLRGAATLHGWSHTYSGATVIATVVLFGRPIWSRVLERWNAELRHARLDRLASPGPIGWLPAALGAYLGTYSHVFLDSLMHYDIRPLAPFSVRNGLLGLMSIPALEWACVAAGAAGLMMWAATHWRARHG
jgi:hypothetical protein